MCQQRDAKSRLPWWEGDTQHLLRPIAAEWQLLKVQRSVATQDYEWKGTAAAVIGCNAWVAAVSLKESVESSDTHRSAPIGCPQLRIQPLKPAVDGFGLQIHGCADGLAAVARGLMTQEG